MIHAYNRDYLESARRGLGRMMDHAVNGLGYKATVFWKMFLECEVSSRFGNGDVSIVVGRSGVELVYETLWVHGKKLPNKKPVFPLEKSPEYWAGWILAYTQWWTGLSFYEMNKVMTIDEVISDYRVYHEMDSRQWVDCFIERYRTLHPVSRLQERRKAVNMSQGELARMAEVPVRTIQQYEQRIKNIGRAAYEVVHRLGKALGCSPDSLLELVAPCEEVK